MNLPVCVSLRVCLSQSEREHLVDAESAFGQLRLMSREKPRCGHTGGRRRERRPGQHVCTTVYVAVTSTPRGPRVHARGTTSKASRGRLSHTGSTEIGRTQNRALWLRPSSTQRHALSLGSWAQRAQQSGTCVHCSTRLTLGTA